MLKLHHCKIWRRCDKRWFSKDLYIGKPDKLSNVRPLLFQYNDDDTKVKKRLKDLQFKTQEWHHNFWSEHNEKYRQSRDDYIKANFSDQKIDAEKMSSFHRQFLLDNYSSLRAYDREWKKMNRTIIYLMAVEFLQRCLLRVFQPFRKRAT